MSNRYPLSKLFNVQFALGLSSRLSPASAIIVNSVNPGFCLSSIRRNMKFPMTLITGFMDLILARSTEEGSRTLVWAATAGRDQTTLQENLKGAYTSDCRVEEPSDFLFTKEGQEVEKRIWVSDPFAFRLILN
jgi:retinol dehydrogenase 12